MGKARVDNTSDADSYEPMMADRNCSKNVFILDLNVYGSFLCVLSLLLQIVRRKLFKAVVSI